ncbi:MAG TPA: hypothetical protein VH187_22685 [Scandinavium sp.]|jgi:hypothetical protein|uniref:hypothetical protein n=1 Tax=Scandinavium sp. TaxID=2830653 RepID=UPI002E36BE10|nr:hypothetical protein [Scandinavium sp.]HEX4503942.1 hypothetical protein [Scandinavium sp.]
MNMKRIFSLLAFAIGMLVRIHPAQAAFNNNTSSVESYSNCSVVESGDNYIFKVMVHFKDINKLVTTPKVLSNPARAVSVTYFTANGQAKALNATTYKNLVGATFGGMALPGRRDNANVIGGSSLACGDSMKSCSVTTILEANNAELTVTFKKTFVNGRGIAIWTGYSSIIQSPDYYWDALGSVYISPFSGECAIIGPNFPTLPAEDITFSLRVPDWDLGEITAKTEQVALTKPEEQLCLDFPFIVAGNTTDYLLNAKSDSMSGMEFRLMNNNKAGKVIPYTLRLSDGKGDVFTFPGNSNVIHFPKDGTSQICYDPTFSIIGNNGTFTAGDYTDVLNFEVITKS